MSAAVMGRRANQESGHRGEEGCKVAVTLQSKRAGGAILAWLWVVVLWGLPLALTDAALGWATYGPDWAGDDTTMDVWLQADSWNNSAEDALYRWNNIGASSFDFYIDIDNNNHCSRLCTSANAVEWENFSDGICSDSASGALAICRLNWIIDFCNADVLFNNQYTWTTGARPWTTNAPYEFNTVAIHEFGHALGLEHENRWVATMNSIYHANNHLIHGDDRAGCRHLYPSGSMTDITLTNWTKNDNSSATAARLVNGPTSATAGQTVSTEWVLENLGTTSITCDVRWYLSTNSTITTSDTVLSTNTGAWISGAGSGTFTKNLTIPSGTSAGTYWIGLIVDYNNAVAESNENNNALAQPRSVTITCPSQSAPGGVSATDGTYTDRVYVSWNSVSGATQYQVYRNTSSSTGGAVAISSWQSSRSYNDYSATPEVTYYYWVKARNACGSVSGFSGYNTGYRAQADFCKTPPSYDYTITPLIDWETTSTSFGMEGCRIYRIYMYPQFGYDFTVCSNDGVGGSCSPGDGDFRMYNAGGTQQWYIDGVDSCGYDASTLGTIYESWSPPTEGYYYLKVEEYYDNEATFTLAYRLSGEHCTTPPAYDYSIIPFTTWQTADEEFFGPSGCRVYRMFLFAHYRYDFSTCQDDGVGGRCDPGDADFTMFDSSGDQVWYIDGHYSCGYDASTLGSVYEGWSPPVDGYYYLQVSDYYGTQAANYVLAYKSCPILHEPIAAVPQDGAYSVSVHTDLAWVRGLYCDVLDDFNRASGTNMGPAWTEQAGNFSIAANVATGINSSLMTYNDPLGDHLCVDVINNGTGSLQYVALVSGYADLSNNVFVKIQGYSQFTDVGFYFGNNGTNNAAWSETGFTSLAQPFTNARMTVHLMGDTIVVELDSDFDGVPNQTYARGSIPVGLLGGGSGLGAYGNALMDNFGVAAGSGSDAMGAAVAAGAIATVGSEALDATLEAGAASAGEGPSERQIFALVSNVPAHACCPSGGTSVSSSAADIPDGFTVVGGVLVEGTASVEPAVASADLPVASASAPLDPGTILIDFDDLEAPCSFYQTARLTTRYAALGVVFEGPGGNDGGAILNECGLFGVTGHSSPNFLAFNPGASMSDDGTPRTPEIMHFDRPITYLEAMVGSGDFTGGTVTLAAYNADNALVDSAAVALAAAVAPIAVAGDGIVTVVLSCTSDAYFIVDDLQFTPAAGQCMDLGHPTITPAFSTGLGGERSVAVDMNNTMNVSSLDVFVQINFATDLTVTIREVDGTTRGAILASGTTAVLPGGPTWYTVPLQFTFEAGRRYDIGFNVAGDWGNDHRMELYAFNNASLSPALGYDVGAFKVLDGGEWGGGGYGNTLLPHIRVCACAITYDLYFGTSYPPVTLIGEGLTEPVADPTPLADTVLGSCIRYYWRVVARNCCEEEVGPIWTFRTGLPGDLNIDGVVRMPDFGLMEARWGATGCGEPDWCGHADVDRSGAVTMADLAWVVNDWLLTCPIY